MKFKEIIKKWLTEKKRQVKPGSLSAYTYICRRYLIPEFGNKVLAEIDKFLVRDFAYRELETKKAKSVKDIMIVLKSIMIWAQDELEMSIPSTKWNISYPTRNHSSNQIERYSKSQLKQICQYAIESPGNETLALLIAATTGIRIGELCALQFSDIDFNKNVIHISKTMERILDGNVEATGHSSKIIIGPPKTISSNRDVPITKEVRAILKRFAAISKPEYYVNTGKPSFCEPRTFRKHAAMLIQNAGVSPVLKFHALRHTFATVMIENKADPKTVSAILGHANVAVTLNLYVHPSDGVKTAAVHKALKGFL